MKASNQRHCVPGVPYKEAKLTKQNLRATEKDIKKDQETLMLDTQHTILLSVSISQVIVCVFKDASTCMSTNYIICLLVDCLLGVRVRV